MITHGMQHMFDGFIRGCILYDRLNIGECGGENEEAREEDPKKDRRKNAVPGGGRIEYHFYVI